MNTTGKRHPVDTSLNNQTGSALKLWFLQHLRVLLGSLYDPSILGKSPLLEWLNIPAQSDSTAALRKSIINAIDSLKPTEVTPPGTKSSRFYEILRQRYIEQQTQRKVADNIGLSARQLQREEKIAVNIVGESIWRTYNLQDRANLFTDHASALQKPEFMRPSLDQQQDLDWLKTTTPVQATNIYKEIQDILTTLEGVIKTNKIRVVYSPEKDISHEKLYLPAPILRQSLLNILGVCISMVPEGQISIHAIYQHNQVQISIEACTTPPRSIRLGAPEIESLNFADKLIALCNGTIHTIPGVLQQIPSETLTADIIVQINLPSTELITVLFIEDNADTLELYRRYLVDSRYRYVGVRDAREGFSLAKEISPQAIILDVMMPEKDGWSFLAQLRVHPKIQHIPVIICSVLQQANLAQTLGAAEFLHKPVSRADLLSCLDRQMERLATKSH
jgi:CheY-like chemotaxis protein